MKSQGPKSRVSSYESLKQRLAIAESQLRNQRSMTGDSCVTISDIGHAVITMDLEMDKLATEEQELIQKLEHNRAKQVTITAAIDNIMRYGSYKVSYADI